MNDKNALEGGRISVLGARVHNLKNIDVEIPRNKLTVITGMSGFRHDLCGRTTPLRGDILRLCP